MGAPVNHAVDLRSRSAPLLLRAAVAIRRLGPIAAGFAAIACMGVTVASGAFEGSRPLVIGLGVAWLAVLGLSIWRRRHERHRELLDALVAMHLVSGAFAAIDITGGIDSDFYPLLYVMVAFLVAMSHRLVAVVSIAGAVLLESNLWLRHGSIDDYRRLAIHASCIVFFALLHVFFTRGEIARVRLAGKKMIEDERVKTLDDARDFRLSGAPRAGVGGGRAAAEVRLATASVEQIRQSLYQTLDLLKRTMGLHTSALLWLDPTGTSLKLAEVATDCDEIDPGPFPAAGGAVGAALKRRSVVNLDVREGYRGIPFYPSGARVSRFVAVPVLEGEGGHLRGVLCADRTSGPAFTPQEEDVLRAATRSVLRTVENERTFVQTERAKWEQSRLYRASEALGSALGEEQVLDATLRAVREIAEYDFAAVTYYDPATHRHAVKRADGPLRERFEGLQFRDNTALAAMAVKNRSSLPYRGEFDAQKSTVFTPNARLDGMQSLVILPLVASDQAIGSLTIAASRRDAFGASVRPILEIISNQMAVCIANAQMLRRLEELATTDGLTGLCNHRVFQEELDSRLKSAARFGRKLSVILLDIDHFKRVNDEHGHPVGDAVLRLTARLLERCKRETDLVARYGGEEFVVVCEETDRKGAALLAERIRRELEGQPLVIDGGKLRVTCSLGMATYPLDAEEKADLVSRADQALYQAKRGGRNRAIAWNVQPATRQAAG
ncbi:MAG: diguanylate cyclase [Deltaproteobacteria bacterium]|nr:diguanylate cyclase [Deltaproteobacteria bacterium]